MTRYEQELRKLFDGSGLMDRPQYSGRVCVGELGKDLRVRAEFFSAHVADQYDAIRLTVLNRKEGVVDRTLLQFKDVWGKKPVPSNPNFRSGVMPHLWDDHGDVCRISWTYDFLRGQSTLLQFQERGTKSEIPTHRQWK